MSCCDKNDPDAAVYQCMKHQVNVCAECPQCKDPELYCKFRPQCMIHFMEKEQTRKRNKSGV